MNRVALLLVTVAAMTFLGGCGSSEEEGPELAPVTGVVTYNGSPLADASVTFDPESGPGAGAATDANGKFELRTGNRDGAVVGTHKVAVLAEEEETYLSEEELEKLEEEGKKPPEPEEPKSLIPAKYAETETSGLTFDVTDGSNHFEIKLVD